jgi:hypothetical protein
MQSAYAEATNRTHPLNAASGKPDSLTVSFSLTGDDMKLAPPEFLERVVAPLISNALTAMRMKGVSRFDSCRFEREDARGFCSLEFYSVDEFIEAGLAAAGIHKVAG